MIPKDTGELSYLFSEALKIYSLQIIEKDGSTKGRYCRSEYPPTIQSNSNLLLVKYTNKHRQAKPTGFIAYYKTVRPIPDEVLFMAASLTGAYYADAVAFLISPLLDIPMDGYCLTFSYSMRSNLRVKVTSKKHTTTLANWIVDGGRAFHRAALVLPHGIYKLIWETTDARRDFAIPQTPYNRYPATVDQISIHSINCLDIGKFTFSRGTWILIDMTYYMRYRDTDLLHVFEMYCLCDLCCRPILQDSWLQFLWWKYLWVDVQLRERKYTNWVG